MTQLVIPSLVALLPHLLAPPAEATSEGEPPKKDSCVSCHSDPRFLVTNKKLYDYYQQWSLSVHQQEQVSCNDCHGGDSEATDKKSAHGAGVGASDPRSRIYFKNVPETCGRCHEEILEGFRESNHYEHVAAKQDEDQGPTCVTCHGSVSVAILNVNSVQAACSRCHNEDSENHPEIPDEAREILNRFLSMHRFYRYIAIRAEPEEARDFFQEIDVRLQSLSVTWHTFDLEQIEAETAEVLGLLKAKRDSIRKRVAESSSTDPP